MFRRPKMSNEVGKKVSYLGGAPTQCALNKLRTAQASDKFRMTGYSKA